MMEELQVLLIEDNPGDAELIRELLAPMQYPSYRIEWVSNLADGIAMCRRKTFDLVVLDLWLPDSSGIQTVRKMITESPDLPVIVLTGHNDEESGIAAMKCGAQDYLVKGCSGAILSRVIKYAVYRYQAEKKIRESERFLRSTLDALSANIAIIDENGVILYTNRAWKVFAAANGADISAVCENANYFTVCRNVAESDATAAAEFVRGARSVLEQERKLFEMEYACHSPSEKRWFVVRVTPFLGGYQRCAVVAHENITERKEAEKAREQSETKFRDIIDHVGIGFALIAPDLRLIETNRQLRKWFGSEHVNDTPGCCDFFKEMRNEDCCLDCPVKRTFKDGKPHKEVRQIAGGGKMFEIATTPILDEDNSVVTVIKRVEEVGERLALESKLRQAQKMESLGTLAGGIAHDFNNILSAIIGFTQLALEKSVSHSKQQDNLLEVYKASIRAKDLVSQILTFCRMTEAERKSLRIDITVREALKMLRSTLPTSIEIKHSIAKDIQKVMADPTQIHQIVMNLCTNASHAIEPNGGVIEVNLKHIDLGKRMNVSGITIDGGSYVLLSVRDNGCGIPPEIIDSIFDPYFTTKDLGEGTGLGLSMVHGIVKDHGGEITVTSEVGKGSTFTIYLPTVNDVERQKPAVPLSAELPAGNEKILFVDDEQSIRKLARRLLAPQGYAVETAASAEKALELFSGSPQSYHLIISDMTMPNMTGDLLAKEMLQIRKDIPIILCTGYSKKVSEKTVHGFGAKALLMKPLQKEVLLRLVRDVLDAAAG